MYMWEDFKKFAFKGNIIDLAIAVIIGAAFGKIVTSLVNDLLMPLIGVLLGGLNFSKLTFKFGKAVVKYGEFINSVVDFFIIALTIFFILRAFQNFKRKEEKASTAQPSESQEVTLLKEIRDLLKNNS
jgi:large conductance mechanosensitive channel